MRKSSTPFLLCAALAAALGASCKKENKAAAVDKAAQAVDKAAQAVDKAAQDDVASAVAAAHEAAANAGEAAGAATEAAGAAAAAIVPEGEPGPRPEKVTDADVALMEKTVTMLEKVDAAVTAAGNDCKKVAQAIKTAGADGERLMNEGRAIVERYGDDQAPVLWVNRSFGKRIMPIVVRISGHTCASDTDVQAALAPLSF